VFGILNFDHCDLPFDLAQGGEVVSPSTLLRTVSLSNGLSNHLVFVFCYLKFFITETRTLKPETSIFLKPVVRKNPKMA
jgi:hypothetical protein